MGPGNGLGVGTEVDGVLGPLVQDVPAGLYVWDLKVVTDGLYVVRCSPRLRSNDGGDPQTEQVTHSLGRKEGVGGRDGLEVR